MSTYLWPWLYREVLSAFDNPSSYLDDPIINCFPSDDGGAVNLPLRVEEWLGTDVRADDIQPPSSGLETPLDLAVRDATGTLTDFVQETLCHPFMLRRLAVLDQQGELPSALFHAFQRSGVRRCVAACVVEYTHRPVCDFIMFMVSRRYNSYVAMVRQSDVPAEVKKELIEIGNRFWLGGDPIQSQVEFYNVCLRATAGKCEDQRRLTRAWMVLSSRSGMTALRKAIESLRGLAAGKAFFPNLQHKLDELAEIEDPADDVYCIEPNGEEHCRFTKGSLGARVHNVCHGMLDQIDTFLCKEQLEPLFRHVMKTQKREAPLLADEMAEYHDELIQVASNVLHAGAHQSVHLLQNRLERLCALFYRHDLSRFAETGVVRFRQLVSTYLNNHSKGQSLKSLLRTLRNSPDANAKLHPCVPASKDPVVVREHDERFLQHHLMPALKKLILPGGIGRELVTVLFPNPGPLTGILDQISSGIEPAIETFLMDNMRDWLEAFTNPTTLNHMIIDGIEGAWKRDIETERAAGNKAKADKLINLWECYIEKKAKREGRLVDQAGLALGYAVTLWVEAPYPGIHPLMASLVKHVHKTFLQHPALIKNILYHLLDGFFYPLTESMATAQRQQDKVLNRPGTVEPLISEGGPFDDRCMIKLADFVVYVLQSGGDYLGENDDLSSMDRVKATLVRAGLDGFRDAALNMVKGSLPGLLPVNGVLTFPGLVSMLLGSTETWTEERLPAILREHFDGLMED